MESVHYLDFDRKGNEAEIAMEDLVRALRRVVEARVDPDAQFARCEVATLDAGGEAMACLLERTLQEMSDRLGDDVLIDGVHYRRSHDPSKGTYHSLCGPLEPMRATYRPVGERNGATVVPLELAAGLVERATPALAYSIALDYANRTSREYVESMAAAYRRVPSRSTVERIGKAVGAEAKDSAPSIERYLRQGEKLPEEAVAVSLGLDRTSVPYEEERDEGVPPKTHRKTRTKPYVRTAPPPVDVNYRMDYVGTVSLVDEAGEAIVTRKYAATHLEGPNEIVKRMMGDVRAAKRQQSDLNVGVVQDGAPELWNLTRKALEAEPSVEAYAEAIDRYHLVERLGAVLKVTEADPAVRARRLERWVHGLDNDDKTIDDIYDYIKYRAWGYSGKARETMDDNLTYIANNRDRMRYVAVRQAGLPSGSGVTEGSCKSLAGPRVKRSGQRWHEDGVSAVLTLRAIHQSDRLPRFWRHLHRRYTPQVAPYDAMAA